MIFIDQIATAFNISEDEVRAFAQKGEKAVSDWAAFIEKNSE